MNSKIKANEFHCRYCEAFSVGKQISVREMMLGTRDQFEYLECGNCGSLQRKISSTEFNLKKYYPNNYYSLADNRGLRHSIKEFLYRRLDQNTLGERNFIGAFIELLYRQNGAMYLISTLNIKPNSRILDVGCGEVASLLNRLSKLGFQNLVGVDPFLAEDRVASEALILKKCDLMSMSGSYFLIMFNHSLEHVDAPNCVLKKAASLLEPGGSIIVRIPTADSYAYQRYGPDWVQLDAPRHVTIPTRSGFRTLAEKCGLTVDTEIDDSSAFQFLASEQYRKNTPLESRTLATKIAQAMRTPSCTIRARRLNNAKLGDQIGFVLSKQKD